nr:Retrovirus-related Pol polyprotein from transposon RE1 [Ipomoea batatas]
MSQPSSNPPSPTIETSTPSIVVPLSNATHVDIKSPYFLHSSDGTGTTLVVDLLTGIDNYYPWSLAMTMALKGRNKFCFVDGTLPTPPAIDPHHARWHRVNNMVIAFSTANGPRIYDLERRIATIRQQDYSIADYHNILCALWDELTLFDPPPVCTCSTRTAYASQMERCRLFQFLMGLRDTYTQTRSNLLLKTIMPTVKAAYSLLLQDEAQRIIYQSDSPGTSVALQTTAHGKSSLSSNVPLSSVVPTTVDTSILGKYPPPLQMTGQTNEMTPSFTNVAHQPYTRSTQTRSRPKCTHCGLLGHTQQVCYKLHGYPPGHKYYKKGNTNGIPSSTPKPPPPITGSISSDSIQQLLHLLCEVKEPKANLAGISLTLASIFNASTEWVIDTGATDHVCSNYSLFNSPPITAYHMSTISVPNGDTIACPAFGLTSSGTLPYFKLFTISRSPSNYFSKHKTVLEGEIEPEQHPGAIIPCPEIIFIATNPSYTHLRTQFQGINHCSLRTLGTKK